MMSDILGAAGEHGTGRTPCEFGSGVLQVTSIATVVSQRPSAYETLLPRDPDPRGFLHQRIGDHDDHWSGRHVEGDESA